MNFSADIFPLSAKTVIYLDLLCVLNKSFRLSTTSIDTHKRKCSPAIETWQVGGELAVKIFGWTNMDSHDFISSKFFIYKCEF